MFIFGFMKKLLLLLLFASCTPDSEPIETCNCETAKYYDNAPVGCLVYRYNIAIDCETRQPIDIIANSTFIKCLDE